MKTILLVLLCVSLAFAGGEFETINSGGGVAPATTTLEEAKTNGDEVTSANSFAESVKIGDGTDNVRIFVDATLGPIVQPVLNGTVTTWDTMIQDGETHDIVIENGGNNDVCVSIDATGLTTYDPAIESCGTIAGNVTIQDDLTVSGELRGLCTPTTPVGDTHTMVASDCTIINGDADALEVDLIADPTGVVVCFYDTGGGAITLDPNSTDAIIANGLTPSAGDAIQLEAGVGNNVCLQGISASTWITYLGTGTVTDVN